MADKIKRLGVGIKLDTASINSELAKFKSMVGETLKSVGFSGTGADLTREVKAASDQIKQIKRDLVAYQKGQDADLAREEIAIAKQVNAELLSIQKARYQQASALNKSLTASGGYNWMTGGMDSSTRSQLASFYKTVGDEAKATERQMAKLNESLGKQAGLFAGLKDSIIPTIGMFYLAKRGLDMLVGPYLKYLADIETANLGISASLITQGKYYDQTTGKALAGSAALKMAMEDAKKIIDNLRIANFETLATLDELIIAYQTALPVALAKGFDKKQVMDFTLAMVQAAGAIGLPFNQMAEEIRSLLMGTINPRNSRIAVVLGLTNADIRANSQNADQLFTFLMDKLAGFREAGIEAQKTWDGLWANSKDMALMVGGQVFEPLFLIIKQGLKEIQGNILLVDETSKKVTGFSPEFMDTVESLKVGLKVILTLLTTVAGAFDMVGTAYGNTAGFAIETIKQKWDAITSPSKWFSGDYAPPATLPTVGLGDTAGKWVDRVGKIWEENKKTVTAMNNILYKGTGGTGDEGTGSKGTYRLELSAAKEHARAMLEIEKSNYQLRFKELSNYYRLGYLTTDEFYNRELENAEKNLQNRLAVLEIEKEKIENAYTKGMSGKGVTADKKAALADKRDADLTKVNADIEKAYNDHYGKLSDMGTRYYQKRVSEITDLAAHEINMAKLVAEDIVAQNQFSVNEQQKQLQWLYSNGSMNAIQYYQQNAALIQQNKDAAIQAIQIEYDAWQTMWNNKISIAQGKQDQLDALNREKAQKDRELANNMAEVNRRATSEMADNYRELSSTFNTIFVQPMKTGLKSFFDYSSEGFMDFRELALNVINDIYNEMVQKFIVNSLFNALSGGTGSIISTGLGLLGSLVGGGSGGMSNSGAYAAFGESFSFFNAKGNVFSTPGLAPYMNTVVNRPTLFTFAQGAGIFGEDGDEAIMPLKRTRSGDLGVRADVGTASPTNLNVKIEMVNQSGQKLTAQQGTPSFNAYEMIIPVVIDAFDRNVMGMRDVLGR